MGRCDLPARGRGASGTARRAQRPSGALSSWARRWPLRRSGLKQLVLLSDAGHLRQILVNLIKNAREASPKGGAIELGLERRKGEALCCVRDHGRGLPEGDPERAAKVQGITPKSPFQIGGSGSVGTGSLRAMPFLLELHQAGFCVWPFESARLAGAKPQPLLVEMYTRLMTGAVKKSNAEARKVYLAAKKKHDTVYTGLVRGVMTKALGSEDAFDALVSCLEMVRWKSEFAGLKATKDKVLRLEGITWRPGMKE